MASDVVENITEQVIINGSNQQVWAIFISAAAILIAAFAGAWWQRIISRQTLTFKVLMDQLWDGDYIDQREVFIKARDDMGRDGLAGLAAKDKRSSKEAMAIRSILNDYELMALGTMTGVLDETIYKRYLRSAVTNDYEALKPYMEKVRETSPRAYAEYTTLYEKWREMDGNNHL